MKRRREPSSKGKGKISVNGRKKENTYLCFIRGKGESNDCGKEKQ